MQRCCHCQGRFGLVSHRYLTKRFCSKECLGHFKRKLVDAIRKRANVWRSNFLMLFALDHAARPAKVRAAKPLRQRAAS